MPVIAVAHPLVRHKIGLLREDKISTKKFRELTHELARLLAYEATQDLVLKEVEVETPLARTKGRRLNQRIERCARAFAPRHCRRGIRFRNHGGPMEAARHLRQAQAACRGARH